MIDGKPKALTERGFRLVLSVICIHRKARQAGRSSPCQATRPPADLARYHHPPPRSWRARAGFNVPTCLQFSILEDAIRWISN